MTTWAEFRTQVRRTILKDTSTPPAYSDEQVLDAFIWACQTFCEHTALASGVTYDPSQETEYDLPDDIYEPLDVAGLVILTDGDEVCYLDPVRYTPGVKHPYGTKGFYIWGDTLYLTEEPEETDATLELRYFAYYPSPSSDSYTLKVPRWAEGALAYLTGAYTLTSEAVASAGIRQWGEKPDTGGPEDNSLRAQSDWMIKKYQQMVAVHPRQDRSNLFRNV